MLFAYTRGKNMKDKKTIWCISKYASPPKYGVGARLFYIAREFSQIGFDVLLISSDSNHLAKYPESEEIYNFEKYGNLEHIWIKTHKYSRSASIQRLISWIDFELKLFKLHKLKSNEPDVVIISSLSILSIIYGIFLKKKYKCKLVFEIRDIYPLTLTEELNVSKWNPLVLLLGLIEKIGYNNSDLIVGTMPNLKQHVEAIIGKNKDVFYSPIGISEKWYKQKTESSLVDSLFPAEDQFVIGYAGSMGITNAMNSFIESIERMASEKDVYFVLVGDGDLKDKFVKKLSGLSNVKIGPKINSNEIPYFLSKCDLLYLSTHNSKIWDYGQSLNKLIDYMMSGKPVVASYSGYQSMLNEANSGLFIPTNNVESIVSAIKYFKDMDPSERESYGKRGRVWIEDNHNYKNIALNYRNKILELFITDSQTAD
jgi:glycosyltransferase involved in cell wall biosynthesis